MKLFVLAVLLVYAVERLFETFAQRQKIHGEVVARYTLYLLVISHVAVFLVAFRDAVTRDPADIAIWPAAAGLPLLVVATIGRNWAIRTLAGYHSIHIEIRKDHPLITAGPYKFLRHPYYLSNAIELIALPLLANSAAGVVLGILIYWPALWLRIVLEEAALQAAASNRFSDYKLKTPRLIPRVGEII